MVVGLLQGSVRQSTEALGMRMKDLDVERREVTVGDGKRGREIRRIQELLSDQAVSVAIDLHPCTQLWQPYVRSPRDTVRCAEQMVCTPVHHSQALCRRS